MDFQRAAELVLETKAIVMDEKAARQVTVKGQADYAGGFCRAVLFEGAAFGASPTGGFSGGGAGECGL